MLLQKGNFKTAVVHSFFLEYDLIIAYIFGECNDFKAKFFVFF